MPVLASCAASPSAPPTPESGEHIRLVLDDVTLPADGSAASGVAVDFNGDGILDNVIGDVIAALVGLGGEARDDASVRSLIGSGGVPSVIDVFGAGSDVVGIEYQGRAGDAASVLRATADGSGGYATDGVLPASLTVLIPVLQDADAIAMQLDYAAIALTPTGSGGYDVVLQGLVEPDPLVTAGCAALFQMIAADPAAHADLVSLLDTNHDGTLSPDECTSYMRNLVGPDVTAGSNRTPYTSLGIALHVLAPPSVPPSGQP